MMTTPPTRWTTSCTGDSDWPTSPAITPKLAKTVAKPSTKIPVAGTARDASCASTDSPATMPR